MNGHCSKCLHESEGVVIAAPHRRCGGSKGAALKAKSAKLPSADRGTWLAGNVPPHKLAD